MLAITQNCYIIVSFAVVPPHLAAKKASLVELSCGKITQNYLQMVNNELVQRYPDLLNNQQLSGCYSFESDDSPNSLSSSILLPALLLVNGHGWQLVTLVGIFHSWFPRHDKFGTGAPAKKNWAGNMWYGFPFTMVVQRVIIRWEANRSLFFQFLSLQRSNLPTVGVVCSP